MKYYCFIFTHNLHQHRLFRLERVLECDVFPRVSFLYGCVDFNHDFFALKETMVFISNGPWAHNHPPDAPQGAGAPGDTEPDARRGGQTVRGAPGVPPIRRNPQSTHNSMWGGSSPAAKPTAWPSLPSTCNQQSLPIQRNSESSCSLPGYGQKDPAQQPTPFHQPTHWSASSTKGFTQRILSSQHNATHVYTEML